MFETVLSSVGLGSARIDLKLDKPFVKSGEKVSGKIYVKGGSASQTVEGLSVFFVLRSLFATTMATISEKIATIHVSKDEYTIQANEEKVYPFEFKCPTNIPSSSVNTRYYFVTNLELKHAIDSHDNDYIEVLPTGFVKHFWEGISLLGLKTVWEGLIGDDQRSQLVTLQPSTYFHGKFHSVSFIITEIEDDEIEGIIEITGETSPNHTFLSKLLLDHQRHKFELQASDLTNAAQAKGKIEELIKRHLQGISKP